MNKVNLVNLARENGLKYGAPVVLCIRLKKNETCYVVALVHPA